MNIRDVDLVPFANKVITYYAADGTIIAVYDDDYDPAFLAALILKKNQAASLDNPKGKTDNMVADTLSCNEYMNLMREQMVDLKYKLKKCIRLGTIADSLDSFFTSEVTIAADNHDFEKFAFFFLLLDAKVNLTANAAALDAVGFTSSELGNLLTTYTNAKNANTGYMNTETDRVNLVPVNKSVRVELRGMLSGVVNAAYACFSNPLNTSKRKLWVQNSILKLIRPTPVKKPRDKHFTAMERRSLYSGLANRWLLELTFSKGKGVMTVGRAMTIDGIPSGTEVLPFGMMVSKKKKDWAGTGEFLIVTYTGTDKGRVTTFIIKP
jgi:hypothetical protein